MAPAQRRSSRNGSRVGGGGAAARAMFCRRAITALWSDRLRENNDHGLPRSPAEPRSRWWMEAHKIVNSFSGRVRQPVEELLCRTSGISGMLVIEEIDALAESRTNKAGLAPTGRTTGSASHDAHD